MNKKICIVGGPGAGKSTVARKLADRIGAPIFDLDECFWNSGPKSPDELHAEMARIAGNRSWVAEGIYTESAGDLIKKADVVLWIEVPLPIAIWRIVLRHVKRSLARNNQHPGTGRLLRFIRTTVKYHLGDRGAGAPLGTERRRYTRRFLAQFRGKVVGLGSRDVARWIRAVRPSAPLSGGRDFAQH